jgi:hypothetical protein
MKKSKIKHNRLTKKKDVNKFYIELIRKNLSSFKTSWAKIKKKHCISHLNSLTR